MSLSPFKARLALLSFLAVASVAATNIFYLQDATVTAPGGRFKAERVKARAEAERARRLALEAKEGTAVAQATPQGRSAAPTSIRQLIEESERTGLKPGGKEIARTGEFAVTAPGFFERIVTPAIAATTADPASQTPAGGDGELRLPEIVKAIQTILGQKGYEPGTPDGVVGIVTRAAIMAYEHDSGLPISGEPSEPLLRHMQGLPVSHAGSGGSRQRSLRSPSAEHVVRSVQQSLAQLGYFASKIDGRSSEDTVRAIREYEMDAGLTPSGRISAPLLLKLTRATGGAKAVQR